LTNCGRNFPQAEKNQGAAWLKDKYGRSWQIIPLSFRAMLQMGKIEINRLQEASKNRQLKSGRFLGD
jgi:hypothetical protein